MTAELPALRRRAEDRVTELGWLVRSDGPVPYAAAYEAMHVLAERRLRDEVPDTLILLEHPPVYTAGRRWDPRHVRWTRSRMEASGAEFHLVDRGGSVTFHGPGQLVGYPILDLGPAPDVIRYLRDLEEVVIRASSDMGVVGLNREDSATGVWAEDRKLCAIGVRFRSARVTLHGFALNCTNDLGWFEAIVPCGLADRGVVSLSELAGRAVTVEETSLAVARRFEEVFGLAMLPVPSDHVIAQVMAATDAGTP